MHNKSVQQAAPGASAQMNSLYAGNMKFEIYTDPV